MKADPNKEPQREKLMDALKLINNKLDFGLELKPLPLPENESKNLGY